VRDRDAAARVQAAGQRRDDASRVVGVGHEVQHGQQ
jgi:hypothetical protein